jgi:hypothetical protein
MKLKLFDYDLPKTYHFWVVHHNGRWAKAMNAQSYSSNNEGIKHFQKLETNITKFFKQQLDAISLEETQSVLDGLQNDNNTLYVIGLDNGLQYHVVVAVQYVAVTHGVFVNWLAVENWGHERN